MSSSMQSGALRRAGHICSAALLLVMLAVAPTSAQEAPTYTVEAGDTLYRIATTHGLSIEQLKALNGLRDNRIYPGQVLRLVPADGGSGEAAAPGLVAVPETGAVVRDTAVRDTAAHDEEDARPAYVVQAGDTFYSLAARFGVAAESLYVHNNRQTAPLTPGDTLRLPPNATHVRDQAVPPAADARGTVAIFPDAYIGRLTASGMPYDPGEFIVSHARLPLGTIVLLTNPSNGRRTFARVADRKPAGSSYMIDASAAVARALGIQGGRPVIELYVVGT